MCEKSIASLEPFNLTGLVE